jgi:hypothetical protein
MERALKLAARTWRKVAGNGSSLERAVKRRYRDTVRVERTRRAEIHTNQHGVVIRSRAEDGPRRGVFLRGGCDLPSLFLTAPMFAEEITHGAVAIARPPEAVGSSQTGQLLQALDGVPQHAVRETCQRLRVRPAFFEPTLFDETFDAPGLDRLGRFPKSIVVLSVGSDLTRSLHQHKEHGFLVDIGGWWLNQSLDKAIQDADTLAWFKRTFEPVGRISVEDFATNLSRIARELRQRTAAELIVLNTLVLEPNSPHHNYQLLAPAHFRRRREFNVALAEVSHELGFHVIDVDGILKRHGVREQVDFAHFPIAGKLPVAAEAFRVFREIGIV